MSAMSCIRRCITPPSTSPGAKRCHALAHASTSWHSPLAGIPPAVDGAADDPAPLGIRQEQVVVDDAPAILRGIDHAQPELFERGFLGGADPCDPAGDASRERE